MLYQRGTGCQASYRLHRPHDGSALSQPFFCFLQLRQTLDDFAAAAACCDGEVAAEDPAADIWVGTGKQGKSDGFQTWPKLSGLVAAVKVVLLFRVHAFPIVFGAPRAPRRALVALRRVLVPHASYVSLIYIFKPVNTLILRALEGESSFADVRVETSDQR